METFCKRCFIFSQRYWKLQSYNFRKIATHKQFGPCVSRAKLTWQRRWVVDGRIRFLEVNQSPHPAVIHRRLYTTVDEDEVAKFTNLFESWWDISGEFQALHALNDLRIPLVRDALVRQRSAKSIVSAQPLTDTVILDVGCGGGILSEPLARLGATVIGIDAASENIRVAQEHASHDPLLQRRLKYICAAAEDLLTTDEETFDAVIASEVLEHVSEVESLVATCSRLAKPGGSIFFTTINKTWFSYALAVVGAEDIARVVPPGTHDWNKFIPPENLQRFLQQNDCQTRLLHGMIFNPLTKRWSWGTPKVCNYAIHAVKNEAVVQDPTNEMDQTNQRNT